jgi:hypothetical protein
LYTTLEIVDGGPLAGVTVSVFDAVAEAPM